MNLKLQAQALVFLDGFKGITDIRYYLNGIYIKPLPPEEGGGVLAAATNGHILGLWHDPEGHADRAVIASVSKPLVTACRRRMDRRHIVSLDGRLAVIEGEERAEVYVQPNVTLDADKRLGVLVNGWEVMGVDAYPRNILDVPCTITNETPGARAALSAKYVEVIARSFQAASLNIKYPAGLQFRQAAPSGYVTIVSADLPQAVAVLMPMAHEMIISTPPWLARVKAGKERRDKAMAAPLPVHEPSDAVPPDDMAHEVLMKRAISVLTGQTVASDSFLQRKLGISYDEAREIKKCLIAEGRMPEGVKVL